MERCPCCNARLRERTICSRCKSDLSLLISSASKAQYWFLQAIHYHLEDKIESSISAICLSLDLKKMQLASHFREFLIQQHCDDILGLLAEKKLFFAKQRLYKARMLFPYSQPLQQLNSFSEYLLTQHPEYLQSFYIES